MGDASSEYRLSIEQKPGYLHARVTGRNCPENVMRYMDEIHRECVRRECFRVLIEESLEGPRLATPDVFRIMADGSRKARGDLKAIAFVDVSSPGGLMRFAETVAINRGLPVAVFPAVAAAEEWLRSEASRDDESRARRGADEPR